MIKTAVCFLPAIIAGFLASSVGFRVYAQGLAAGPFANQNQGQVASYPTPSPLPPPTWGTGRLWPWDYRGDPGATWGAPATGMNRQPPVWQGAAAWAIPTAPTAAADRPFSTYQAPPPFSPYVNMYRVNTTMGVDNYNLYVRPMLEQQLALRQLQSQLESAQAGNRGQGALGQNPSLVGRYMSLQTYYPGFSQR